MVSQSEEHTCKSFFCVFISEPHMQQQQEICRDLHIISLVVYCVCFVSTSSYKDDQSVVLNFVMLKNVSVTLL